MKLNKPPVIEAWIEFCLDLSEEPVDADGVFDEAAAREFVYERISGKFDEKYEDIRYELKHGAAEKDGRVEVSQEVSFDRLRTRNSQKNFCLQVGRDILVLNQLKVTDEWGGYERMRDEAFENLAEFLKYRRLKGIQRIALSYRDMVKLPANVGKNVEEYLKVVPTYPESFGPMMLFNLGLHLPSAIPETILDLSIKSVRPTKENRDCSMFLMDWQMCPTEKATDYEDFGRSWLDLAHKEIRDRFITAFTESGLALFEPEEL